MEPTSLYRCSAAPVYLDKIFMLRQENRDDAQDQKETINY